MSTTEHNVVPEGTATLDAVPKEDQIVTYDNKLFTTKREGLAHILIPANARTELDPKRKDDSDDSIAQSVFYNPIQQFNRDLSVLAIRAYGEDLMALRQAKLEMKKNRQKEKRGTKRKVETSQAAGDSAAEGAIKKSKSNAESVENTESIQEQPVTTSTEDKTTGIDVSATLSAEIQESLPDDASHQKPLVKPRFKILDALSATGLRALRYAHEIPFVTQVTANDLSKQATHSIEANIKHNKLEDKITAVTSNAMSHMYSFVSHPAEKDHDKKYDVIDLDPYGTAATFLDAAVQAVNDGGLLCVTCTDAGVWASCGYPEKCFSLYGGTPLKGHHSHEGGLRLILHSVAMAAARYGMSIEPLLSLSIDYYARVFVRVYKSPVEVKLLAGKTMLVYSCDGGCGAWKTQYLARNQKTTTKNGQVNFKYSLAQGPTTSTFCEHCGYKTHMNGPMYGGPLHNPAFLETILSYLPELDTSTYKTLDRIEGMLSTALEETMLDGDPSASASISHTAESNGKQEAERLIPKLDPAEVDAHPFYFVPSALAKVLHCRAPPEAEMKGAFRHAGYMVTRSHAKPGVIRTNAPWSFIWEVMKEWVVQKAPIKEDAIKKGTPGFGILHGTKHKQESRIERRQPPTSNAESNRAVTQGDNATQVDRDAMDAMPTAVEDRTGDANANSKPTTTTTTTTRQIVFDAKLGKDNTRGSTGANRKRLVRYQTNPRANWGPMNRAKGGQKERLSSEC